ncbi:MAG: site-2 protease family protein [Flavobacteriales bacterium]
MKGSLFIGKYAGIGVYIHWTFSLLILYFIGSGIVKGLEFEQISWTILFVLCIFTCVVFHEYGHALSARRYGIKTKHITLLPIGGVAQLESLPEKPKHELVVALAGPMVNLIIAGILLPFVIHADMNPESLLAIGSSNFLVYLFSTNLVLAFFNLLPAFPMDGGRVFRALLSFSYGRAKATAIAARLGQLLSLGFVLLGLFSNPFLVLIGIFIFLGAQTENNMVQAQHSLANTKVGDVMMRDFAILHPTQTLGHAASLLINSQNTDFVVMENERLLGLISRDDLIKGITVHGMHASVSEAMNTRFKILSPETLLSAVYAEIRLNNTGVIPVMKDGSLLGVIDAQNVIEFMLLRNSIGQHQA